MTDSSTTKVPEVPTTNEPTQVPLPPSTTSNDADSVAASSWSETDHALDLALADNTPYEDDRDILTEEVPNGLGFAAEFIDHLPSLGIHDWDSLTRLAHIHDPYTVLAQLTPSVYKQHRRSIRRFITFGYMCTPNQKTKLPQPSYVKRWMPRYVDELRGRRHSILRDERQARWTYAKQNKLPVPDYISYEEHTLTSQGSRQFSQRSKTSSHRSKASSRTTQQVTHSTPGTKTKNHPSVPDPGSAYSPSRLLQQAPSLRQGQAPSPRTNTPTQHTAVAAPHPSAALPELAALQQTVRQELARDLTQEVMTGLPEPTPGSHMRINNSPPAVAVSTTPANSYRVPPALESTLTSPPAASTRDPDILYMETRPPPRQATSPSVQAASDVGGDPKCAEHQKQDRKASPPYDPTYDPAKGLYQHAYGEPPDTFPDVRPRYPGRYYSNLPEFIKTPLPSKVLWDGTINGFPKYKLALEGFYRQLGAGYLFNPTFQKIYKTKGLTHTVNDEGLPKYIRLTVPQLENATQHLYGAIQTSTRTSQTAQKYLLKYEDTQDGIMTWIELLNTQDKDGNLEVHEQRLINITQREYYVNYPGGLLKYLEDIFDAYCGLDNVGNVFSSRQKKQTLLKNLQGISPQYQYLVEHCRDQCETFSDCYKYLRDKATLMEDRVKASARRKANQAVKQDNDSDFDIASLITKCEELGMTDQARDMLRVAYVAQKDEFNIPYRAWKLLVEIFGQEKMREFMDKRDGIKRKESGGTPAQYQKGEGNQRNANLASQVDDEDDISEASEDSVDDDAQDLINQVLDAFYGNPLHEDRHANAVISTRSYDSENDIDFRASHIVSTTVHHQMIMDTGADTSIIGPGWNITATYGPTVGLIGFDSTHARKKNLQICTAETIIEHPDAGPILIQAHNVIHNPTAKSTLLSEYQLSSAGCLIDSKPPTHKYPNGMKGTLTMKIPNCQHTFKLKVHACLIGMDNRLPTEEESDRLKPYEITLRSEWDPSRYHDQGFTCGDHLTPFSTFPNVPAESNVNVAKLEPETYFDEDTSSLDTYYNCVDPEVEIFHETQIIPDNMLIIQENSIVSELTMRSPGSLAVHHPRSASVHDGSDLTMGLSTSTSSKYDLSYYRTVQAQADPPTVFKPLPYSHEGNCEVRAVVNKAKTQGRTIHPRRMKKKELDYKQLQPCFAFLPIDVIKRTMDCTTQLAKWHRRIPLQRHWLARFPFLNVHRLREPVATDTYFANCQALGGDTCAQVFYGIQSKMINVYPMKSESQGPHAYEDFIRDQGCPTLLRRDNAKMEKSEDFLNICRQFGIGDGFTEPHHPHQNPAENRAIKWIKHHSEVVMNKTGAPPYVWPDCAKWIADIHNVVADESLGYRTPYEKRHGVTPDVSAYMLFTFWEKILYHDTEQSYPDSKEVPGHFLGIAQNTGDALTFVILGENDERLVRSVIRSASGKPLFGFPNARISHPEYNMVPTLPENKPRNLQNEKPLRMEIWDGDQSGNTSDSEERVKETPPDPPEPEETNQMDIAQGTQEQIIQDQPVRKTVTFSDRPMRIDKGLSHRKTKTKAQKAKEKYDLRRPKHRYPTRNRKANQISTNRLTKGVLALFAFSQVLFGTTPVVHLPRIEGSIPQPCPPMEMEEEEPEEEDIPDDPKTRKLLTYHHMLDSNKELEDPEDMYQEYVWKVDKIISHKWNGSKTFVHVRWKQGNYSRISLRNLRLHDPIACVIYALKKKLLDTIEWTWVNDYIADTKSYHKMVIALKARANFGTKYKFGVEVPRSIRHAMELDKKNGNKLWEEAILKELTQLDDYETFKLVENEDLSEYQKIPYHFVFDVKFDLRHKARLVAGGNHCEVPKDDTYSGVISLTAVRILFLLATLNKLDLYAADVGNAFLYGTTRQKVYIIAGPEFGPERQGKPLIIYKGLYGLASSGARFHEHLSDTLRKMGFTPSKADSDLWLRDLGTHYEYLGTYVDDLLIASKDPEALIADLKEHYILKGVGEPVYYLGGDVEKLGEEWSSEPAIYQLSAATYVQNVVEKFKKMFSEGKANFDFQSRNTPMNEEYHPELDDSPLLGEEMASRYRSIIGSLQWAISLGRCDIQYATTSLARYGMAPREGHLQAAFRVLGYLAKFKKAKVIIDPFKPDHSEFLQKGQVTWQEFYPDATEEIPDDAPEPKGTICNLTIWVDADHARDQLTRRSMTGIFMMVNNTIIRTFCKMQSTVETSTYGSELVAARIATDMAVEMRYTLRMLGIQVDGPVQVFGDNKSVIINTTLPSSVLKKKHNAIAYHRVREAIAANILNFTHIPSTANLADLLTKPLGNASFHALVKPILFRNPGEPRWPQWEV